VLRIHFTGEDLARTQVAAVPDPLWEIVMSLQALRSRYGRMAFDGWRATAAAAVRRHGIRGQVRMLGALVPTIGYFPDFLTPAEGALGLDEGIDAVLATPGGRLRHEVGRLPAGADHAPWVRDLMSGRAEARSALGRALRAYHQTVLAPYWPRVETDIGAHWAVAARTRRVAGMGEMLAGLSPSLRWRPPVLEADFGQDRDLYLRGRGIMLIPSYFHWNRPIPLADPSLPPVLVYRIVHEPRATTRGSDALSAALGASRAAVLRASEDGASTGDIARRCQISPAAASRHTTLLRDAGLMVSRRQANTVVHTPTALGTALLLRAC
jgi:DNA-binding transcriptional ArsR family regulator